MKDIIENSHKKWLSAEERFTFVCTFLMSIFTHAYFFLGKFTNTDEIKSLHSMANNQWLLGRWMQEFVASLRGGGDFYNLPWVIGLLTFIYLALTACLLASLLELKKYIFLIILSGIIATSPILCYLFSYLGLSDLSSAALLFSVLAVWIIKKFHSWLAIPISASLLMLSCATYPAYIGVAMGLCIILLLKQIFSENCSLKSFFLNSMRMLIMGILGVTFYLFSTQISAKLHRQALSSYKGIDSMGTIPLEEIGPRLVRTYKNFFGYYVSNQFIYLPNLIRILYFLLVGLALIVIFFLLKKSFLWKKIAALILLIAIPLAANLTDFIVPSGSYTLTIYSFIVVDLFLLVFCSRAQIVFLLPPKYSVLIKGITLGFFVIIWSGVIACNTYYLKADLYSQRVSALYNRILSRVEETPGFSTTTPVLLVGTLPNTNYQNSTEMFDQILNDQGLGPQFTGLDDPMNPVLNTSEFASFCNDTFGVPILTASEDQWALLQRGEELYKMSMWPANGSVANIDGIIVVNFNFQTAVSAELSENSITWTAITSKQIEKNAEYAYYLFKDGIQIDDRWYEKSSVYQTNNLEPGLYQVLVFVSADGETRQTYSPEVKVS